ncbi:MAG: ComF family protein, partial [Clostridia bacterium]|nr:ComF family protein [Clostridia bacterium]
ISKYIANMLLEDKKYFEGVDYITFVPMSKERFKERDFNQAEEIAKDVSAAINIPVISVLEKIKENTHQAGLTRKERIKNIANTIEVKNDESFKIKDKTILVIDDVFTTGSTLSECAKVLKKKGANKVKTLTFAKTRQNMIKTS